jgi:hypothetical protein
MLGVVLARLARMVAGVSVVAAGGVGMVGGFFVLAGVVLLGRVAMVLGGVFVMFGRLAVMFAGWMGHLGRPPQKEPRRRRRSPWRAPSEGDAGPRRYRPRGAPVNFERQPPQGRARERADALAAPYKDDLV